jgi:type IV pilus assembly protein PilQ
MTASEIEISKHDNSAIVESFKKESYIKNIDFVFKEKNIGLIDIDLKTNQFSSVKIENKKDYSLIILKNVYLPDDLNRKMVVSEFDTTVESIDSYYDDTNSYIKINFKEKSILEKKEANGKLTFIVKKDNMDNQKDKKKYNGKPISIEFQDISVREVLRILAQYTAFNLVTSDNVTGNITVSLKNVPFEHALEVILQSKGLDKRVSENIIYIAPTEELTKLEESRLEAKNKIRNLAPLSSEFFQIKYAKAEDLQKVISAIITERGKIMIDDRTNTVIVKDIDRNLNVIKETIDKLDIPIKQVLIEARIVIARKSKSEELGVKWGGVFTDGKNYAGSDYKTVIDHYTNDEFINGEVLISEKPLVDLGVSGAAGSIAFGLKSSTGLLDLELSAMEKDGDGEVVARPKIITADKKKAIIKSGTQIPYQQSSGNSGATTIAFKDAVMLLEVTPQITPDGRIIMDIKVNQDSVGELTTGGPSIDTTQIETQVLVNNNQTIVLGGIFRAETISNVTKIPLLGDLPAIGRLFRNTVDRETKTELLIFITPKLIEDDILKY